jgi:hypothetical protein
MGWLQMLIKSIIIALSLSVSFQCLSVEPQLYKGGIDKTPTYVKHLNLDENSLFKKYKTEEFDKTCLNEQTLELQQNCLISNYEQFLLKVNKPSDQFFNILILGLDQPTNPNTYIQLDDIKKIPALTSRADSINLLSLDLISGHHVLFSIYRGTIPLAACWKNSNLPLNPSDQIITNLFRIGTRTDFIQCVKTQMTEYLSQKGLNKRYHNRLNNDQFAIHATVEIDIHRLKVAMTNMIAVALSNLTTFNKIRSSSGMTMNDIENLPGVVDAMRNRHDWSASGYQRAFNHAKFITYSLSFIGKTLSIDSNFLNELEDIYGYISSSLSFNELNTLMKTPQIQDQKMSPLYETLRFKNTEVNNSKSNHFVSPIEICEFGPENSALIYSNGINNKSETLHPSGLLKSVETQWIAIPNPEYTEQAPYLKQTLGVPLPE